MNTAALCILSRPCTTTPGPWTSESVPDIAQACEVMRRAAAPRLFRVFQRERCLLAVASGREGLSVLDMPPWTFYPEAAAWSATRDWFTAWEDTDNAVWMLGALCDVDPRAAVRAASALVRLYAPRNPRSLDALDTCDAWLRGKTSTRRMQRAHAVAMAEGRRHIDTRRAAEAKRVPEVIFASSSAFDTLLPALDAMNHDAEATGVTNVGFIAAMCRQLSSDDAPKHRSLGPVPTNVDGFPLSYEMDVGLSVRSVPEQILRAQELADRDAGVLRTDAARTDETITTIRRAVNDGEVAVALVAAARRKGTVSVERLCATAAERSAAPPPIDPLAV